MSIRVPHNVLAGDVIHSVGATAPAAPVSGTIWLDTSSSPNLLKVWNGTTWLLPGAAHIYDVGARPDTAFRSELGDLLLSAKFWPQLSENSWYDGGNWFRYDNAQTAARLQMGNNFLGYALAVAASGVIAWVDKYALDVPASSDSTQLRVLPAFGNLILVGRGSVFVGSNATWDGSNWNRADTSLAAALLQIDYTGKLSILYAPAGSGAITWTTYRLVDAATYPPTAWLDLGTVAAFASGWGPYPADQFRPMVRRLPDGMVVFRGLVRKATAVTAGETMFTMPAAWRPGDAGYNSGGSYLHLPSDSVGALCTIEFSGSTGVCSAATLCQNGWVSIAPLTYQNNP